MLLTQPCKYNYDKNWVRFTFQHNTSWGTISNSLLGFAMDTQMTELARVLSLSVKT
jgi:hypothetical protein